VSIRRYEIADGGADWADAERQVRAAQGDSLKSTIVSVKSGKGDKRKAGVALGEAYKEEEKFREGKKKRKGK
jgi:N-acetyltransferase 10